nr:hypothetical protein [Tanacetum cinerariifolium]
RRNVIINEDTVRQALRLDDADSIDCLPNEEIFAELARMGYEKPSTKLTFYKQQQVHDVVADTAENDDAANEIFAEPTPPLPTTTTTPPPQQALIPSPSQVEFTPPSSPHQSIIAQPSSPSPQQSPSHDTGISMDLLNQLLETCATLTKKVSDLEQDKIAQAIKITKLKQRVRRLEKKRKLKASRFKRLRKVGTAQRVESSADTVARVSSTGPTEVKEVLEVVTTAKLITDVVTTATTPIIAALVPKASAPRRRRGVIIQDLEEPATASLSIQLEAFLEKGEKEIEEEDGKRKSKNLKQKAAKKKKIDEEVEEIKTHLQIVPNDEDDVYTEATPLALKNFDREDLEMLWKIVQERFASSEPKNFSDDFLLNALKTMFEKPNVNANIWKNQRGRYGLAKVKSWKLLELCNVHIITFTTTQMILPVERIYPLIRFTLE